MSYKFSTSARPKVLGTPHVLKILTSKCAFRHSRVHFFNISTYKSGPNTSCFVHFYFKMWFSPQRHTIFRHLNFKKWSRIVSFLTFSLPNVLFATASYNFSTSELQKVVPDRQFFNIFASECAFRHSGVQFFDIRTCAHSLILFFFGNARPPFMVRFPPRAHFGWVGVVLFEPTTAFAKHMYRQHVLRHDSNMCSLTYPFFLWECTATIHGEVSSPL